MNRYMKDTQSGTLHIYQPAWLGQEGCSFVECDAAGNYLNLEEIEVLAVEAEAEIKATKVVKKSAADIALDEAVAEAAEALSADASNI